MRTHRRSRRRSRDAIIRRGCSNVSESGKKGWQNHCVFLFDSILFYIQYCDLLRVFVCIGFFRRKLLCERVQRLILYLVAGTIEKSKNVVSPFHAYGTAAMAFAQNRGEVRHRPY